MLKSEGTDTDGPLGLSSGTALGGVPNRYQLVLLHILVTIVLCYQLLFSRDALLSFELRQLVALGLIGSIVGLILLPAHLWAARWLAGALVMGDTIVTTAIIYLSGHASSNLYVTYFLIMLIAAFAPTLEQMIGLSVVLCAAYGVVLYLELSQGSPLSESHLLQIPILLILAIFYGVTNEAARRLSRDKTDLQQAEVKLQKAREAAEIASRAKSEFLASMSHEIRTPLNAIIGMADLLWETTLNPEQRKYVRIFRRAGNTLLALLNDILDLSKVDAGHLQLEAIDFDLNDLIGKAAEIMSSRANAQGLELICHSSPDVPCNLLGDPKRLHQILVNLIGNAVKFTERGEVVLRVENDPVSKEPGVLRFSVADTGTGIPADKLDRIFERFTQVHPSLTRKYGGTGLGLAISKQLVELMGGRIWAESTIGQGSTFYFTARFGVQSEPKWHRPLPLEDLRGLKTLVVDDKATNRLILREILTDWDAMVTELESAQEVLPRLEQAQEAGKPYKLVMLDCLMPDMDGFEVAAQIKRTSSLVGLTVVMLTSDRWADDIARTYELGLGGYLVKPISRPDLLEAITIALGRTKGLTPAASLAAARSGPADPGILKILLVDDSTDNRVLIQSYLKATPCRVDLAENGAISVEKFKAQRYDLVITDMYMPVMDGHAATKAMRQWEKEKGIPPTPIIALTAFPQPEAVAKSRDAGCNAHLTKPIKKADLLKTIEAYTQR